MLELQEGASRYGYGLLRVRRRRSFLHGQGVLHREIKPANIMLVGDVATGTAKLGDFGIAAERAESVSGLPGTADYMPPELIARKGVDRRSDIYSLGVTVYALLGGRLPLPGHGERTTPPPVDGLSRVQQEALASALARVIALSRLALSPAEGRGGGSRGRRRVFVAPDAPAIVARRTRRAGTQSR